MTGSDAAKDRILEILAESRVLCVATLRPDGWPQATMVGYLSDGLTLYFAVARDSQKLANIARDPRISIAVGRQGPRGAHVHGLSMAAIAAEVIDPDEVRRLNALILTRYPEQEVFTPPGRSIAVVKATPQLISLIDADSPEDQPLLLRVEPQTGILWREDA
ncbi:pyridoxamine 5'-phosphate oxidase [Caulobacter sp. Root655]|uniref:pyridoxamine 5'-phosphate oxidase family protein n=1 Tax=Caulobacter sp. Root655 TaxID=1736578 RepID=UPI0006F95773|nr:pyridoxamine 5'-phosphate oxidase family protein [Caulobacter sp. Root655]KRA59888.1 pyridoxamine 5'-phosphate oxidase [Caulobacter sp. Root655]